MVGAPDAVTLYGIVHAGLELITINPNPMPLSKETQERISNEAQRLYASTAFGLEWKTGYMNGATAEHVRVLPVVEALKSIKSYMEGLKSGVNFFLPSLDTFITMAGNALQQYEKEVGGEGK